MCCQRRATLNPKYLTLPSSPQVMSADLKEGMEAVTVNGQTVKISLAGGAKINGAKVKKVGEAGMRI